MDKKDFLNKQDVVNKMAEILGYTKKDTETVVNTFFDVIGDFIKEGNNIRFYGVCDFCVDTRSARQCRNPKTGETVDVPAKKFVKIKPKKFFAEKVANLDN